MNAKTKNHILEGYTMTMQELENKRVKISAGTITVKDEYGKTRGMVRGVRPFKSWNSRESMDNFGKLKSSGIWGNRVVSVDNVILDGKQLYYLNDTRPLENYESMRDVFEADPETWGNETKHYMKRKEIAKQAAAAGMTVINCHILTA